MMTNGLFQKFDITTTIHEAFSSEYTSVFVALNPFTKKIFSDRYNPIDRLELTYPLWESVSWNQVASETCFKSIQALANALTDYKSSLYRELKDYLNEKELEWPAVKTGQRFSGGNKIYAFNKVFIANQLVMSIFLSLNTSREIILQFSAN